MQIKILKTKTCLSYSFTHARTHAQSS